MLSTRIEDNITALENAFADCGDYVSRKFQAGGADGVTVYVAYLDMMTNRHLIDYSIISRLTRLKLSASDKTNLFELLRNCGIPTADLKESGEITAIIDDLMTGNTVLFVDHSDRSIVVSSKGFPNRGVPAVETEVSVHGSKEAFCEVFRINTALVRRRIRDSHLKLKQLRVGRRSQTDVALMYIEDIVRPAVLNAVETRIKAIDIDAVPDSGFIAQLIEENWLSPFPQAQMTERPDKAAASMLEGRIVIIVDNTPFALIVPVTMNAFFHASEDYYDRWLFVSLARAIRYAAACMAAVLPGLYMAVAVYHPFMIPLLLTTKMAAARQAVPFPAMVEILLMDAAFELLREAGIRLPGAAGGTIGVVGGLIIGQAAVEAGLVSPIVVIIIALAGISSFAVPNISFVNGFRLVKYAVLILSSLLGLLGFWVGILLSLTHMAGLSSFGIPYMLPFAAGELSREEFKDSIFRWPLFTMKRRPFFANPRETRRLGDVPHQIH